VLIAPVPLTSSTILLRQRLDAAWSLELGPLVGHLSHAWHLLDKDRVDLRLSP
jgi:hypothetical protein